MWPARLPDDHCSIGSLLVQYGTAGACAVCGSVRYGFRSATVGTEYEISDREVTDYKSVKLTTDASLVAEEVSRQESQINHTSDLCMN